MWASKRSEKSVGQTGTSFRTFALVTASIVALSVSSAVVIGKLSIEATDRVSIETEARTALEGFKSAADRSGHTVDLIAIDDDTAFGLTGPNAQYVFNRRIAHKLAERHGHKTVLLLDRDGLRFAFSSEPDLHERLVADILRNALPLLKEVASDAALSNSEEGAGHISSVSFNTAQSDHRRSVYRRETHVATINGTPHILSVAKVVPATPGGLVLVQDAKPSFIVTIAAVEDSQVANVGQSFGLSDLAFTADPADGHRVSQPVLDDTRTPVGHLSWTPKRPGTEMLTNLAPVAGGILAGISGLFFAVGRRLRRNETLRLLQEERYRDFAASGADFYWESDRQHRVIYHSACDQTDSHSPWHGWIGHTRDALPIIDEDRHIIADMHRRMDAREPFSGIEYRFTSPNGSVVATRVGGKPVFSADGQFQGYRGSSTNFTAEMEAREAQRYSESLFRDFAETAADWFWVTDAEHRFQDFTTSFEVLAGFPRSGAMGLTRWELPLHPDDHSIMGAHQSDLDAKRPFRAFRYRLFRKALGTYATIEANGKPYFDKDGTFLGYRGSARDVSVEVKAQLEAEARQHALTGAMRLARMGTWTRLDKEADEIVLSPELADILGLETNERGVYRSSAIFGRVAQADLDRIAPIMEANWDDAPNTVIRFLYERPDGRKVHVESHSETLFGSDGAVMALRGFMRDVTTEVAAKAELNLTLERFRGFVSVASDFCWETDADHRYIDPRTYAGPRADFGAIDYVGKRRWDMPYAEESHSAMMEHKKTVEAHKPVRDFLCKLPNENGSFSWIRCSGDPVFDPLGRFLGYRGTSHDVTEEIERQRELDEQRRSLSQAMSLARMGHWTRSVDEPNLFSYSPELVQILDLPPSDRSDGLYDRSYFNSRIRDADLEAMGREVRTVLAGGKASPSQCRFERDDGQIIDLEIQREAIRDATGAIVGVRGFIRDISEAASIARRAEDQAISLGQATRLAKMGYWRRSFADPDYLILSPELAAILEIEESADNRYLKTDVQARYVDFDRTEANSNVTNIKGGQTAVPQRCKFRKSDGSLLDIEIMAEAECDTDGRVTGMRGFIRDISDEAEAERIASAADLKRAAVEETARRMLTAGGIGTWRRERDSDRIWLSAEMTTLWDVELDPDGYTTIESVFGRYRGLQNEEKATILSTIWQDGGDLTYRVAYERLDGALIDVEVTAYPEIGEDGQVHAVGGLIRDITRETQAARIAEESRAATEAMAATLTRAEALAELGSWTLDVASGKVTWSKTLYSVLGFPENESPPTTREILTRAAPESFDAARAAFARAISVPRVTYEGQYHHPDRGLRHLRFVMETEFNGQSPVRIFGTAQDVTDDRVRAQVLAQRTQALSEAHSLGKMGSWSFKLTDSHITWSDEIYALLRYERATFETSRQAVLQIYLDDGAQRLLEAHSQLFRTRGQTATEGRIRRSDGTVCDIVTRSRCEIDSAGNIVGFFGTIQDITEQKEAERELEKLAYFDPLTGLANRALFHREIERTVAICSSTDARAALLLLDLDRFKEVNDSLGHAAGDELLVRVSSMLSSRLPRGAFLARLGGDEFAVILSDLSGDQVQICAEDIISLLSEPIPLAQGDALIGTSVGIAMLPGDGDTAELVLRHADLALYRAKDDGRGRAQFFEESLSDLVQAKTRLARELKRAIDTGEGLEIRVQPQVHLASGKVSGFEALMRWKHPERGFISPAEFIPIAESSSLIGDLGLWVLKASCLWMKSEMDRGSPAWDIAVNVSAAQLWQGTFETDVERILNETGLPASRLTLELTESAFEKEGESRVRRALEKLRRLGVRVALDDFGTGYSSLGYLNQLPFTKLKIDRVFVDGVDKSPSKRKLLAGIVALGRGLDYVTIAEGAETPGEVEVLRQLGCDLVQGYVFARPVQTLEAADTVARIEREIAQDTNVAA
jgi:diguanylate cyclase (GGDEF)-like protein/PAS domain S-box-containing protein